MIVCVLKNVSVCVRYTVMSRLRSVPEGPSKELHIWLGPANTSWGALKLMQCVCVCVCVTASAGVG